MSPGTHIKLDFIEFIKVIDNIHTEMGLQKGASCIVPVTSHSLVHQALLQSVSQTLMYEGVADKCPSFPQRCLQLSNRFDKADPIIGSFDLGQTIYEVIPVILLCPKKCGLFLLVKL